jgi:hypothetical protein
MAHHPLPAPTTASKGVTGITRTVTIDHGSADSGLGGTTDLCRWSSHVP